MRGIIVCDVIKNHLRQRRQSGESPFCVWPVQVQVEGQVSSQHTVIFIFIFMKSSTSFQTFNGPDRKSSGAPHALRYLFQRYRLYTARNLVDHCIEIELERISYVLCFLAWGMRSE